MTDPPGLLSAARAGDPAAFEQLVTPYRGELRAHCYRMLGSLHDAEDVVQDSLLRAWRSIGTLDDRGLVRAWLYKIATNRCLTFIAQRARRELPVSLRPDTPAAEVAWLEPFPDAALGSPESQYLARESVELAFVAALQYLTGTQRAAIILRDVLGFTAVEAADQLATTPAAVNSALQRARQAVASARPSQRSVLRDLGDDAVAGLVARWIDAWQAGDVDAIVAMLTDDAHFSMPPLPGWYAGTEAIRAFLVSGPLASRWRFLPAAANGQVAFGTYMWDDTAARFAPGGLDVLTLDAAPELRVAAITSFVDADLTQFGLPAAILP